MNYKDYFSFTRGEKRGVVFLLSIIILLIIGIQFIGYSKPFQQVDFSEFENSINEFEKSRETNQLENQQLTGLFDFNPNTISNQEWKKLGFADWQVKIINNYKAKGGSWKTKNDVKKIYGLDSNHYRNLKPYILLPEKGNKEFKNKSKPENFAINYFEFNPNTITESEWKELGFKEWQIKTIFNYKSKGGGWKTKEDVKKIYGLEESDYIKLKPYILLPDETANTKPSKNKKDFSLKVDINKANAKEFTNLNGINSEKYAAIIVKYRNALGGFIRKEQLKEVWNLSEETYLGFEQQVELGNVTPQQIDINATTAKTMSKHPYIDWKIANAIIKYRKANGQYSAIRDIKKIHLINDQTYSKISPYLIVK